MSLNTTMPRFTRRAQAFHCELRLAACNSMQQLLLLVPFSWVVVSCLLLGLQLPTSFAYWFAGLAVC